MISFSTMQVRKTSAFAAAAITLLTALVACAIALPGTANAKIPVYGQDANTTIVHLSEGTYDNTVINPYNKPMQVYVSGKVTIKGMLISDPGLSIFPENGSATLTVTTGIYGGTSLTIGDLLDPSSTLSVIANEKSGQSTVAAVASEGHINVWNAKLTATGLMAGIQADDDINLFNAKVVAKATSKKVGASGVVVYGALQDAYIESMPTVTSSIEASGYSYGISGNMIKAYNNFTVKGTATKTATATTSSPAMGISVSGIEATNSNIRGYATAPSKYSTYTSTSDKIGSAGISCYALESKGSTIYASNKGKYGAGLKAQYVRTTTSPYDGENTTISAYAKNYGTGFATENIEMRYTTVVTYGGKYAMHIVDYGDSEGTPCASFTNCIIKAYGKNTKGSRTGHGIVSNDQLRFSYCNVLVYAKKSSSYYGIRSVDHDVMFQDGSKSSVYAYSTRGYKAAEGVWRDTSSTLKLNKKTYTKAGVMF